MMLRKTTKWVAFLLMSVWLPLQSLAVLSAFAMPIAMLMPATAIAMEASAESGEHASCHEQQRPEVSHAPTQKAACSSCGVCHLVGSGLIPAAVVLAQDSPVERVFAAVDLREPPSQIPEPLEQPPRQIH